MKNRFIQEGQTVKVKSRKWYDANKDAMGNVQVLGFFTEEMTPYLDKTVTVNTIDNSVGTHFSIKEDGGEHAWTIEMIDMDIILNSRIRKGIDWDTVDLDSLNREELIFLANKLEKEVLV